MGVFAVRALEGPSVMGGRRALAIRGNSRFAKVANLTGREAISRAENFISRNKFDCILGSVCATVGVLGSIGAYRIGITMMDGPPMKSDETDAIIIALLAVSTIPSSWLIWSLLDNSNSKG